MKTTTMVALINISLMILTGWLIYYFNNGWWILLYILCHLTYANK